MSVREDGDISSSFCDIPVRGVLYNNIRCTPVREWWDQFSIFWSLRDPFVYNLNGIIDLKITRLFML